MVKEQEAATHGLYVPVLEKCPSYKESKKSKRMTEE